MASSAKILSVILLFGTCSLAACERSYETRAKMERAREKINLPEELEEFGKYNKHRDKLYRERFMEQVELKRSDRRREREADEGIKNGTLMEKYSETPKHSRKPKKIKEES